MASDYGFDAGPSFCGNCGTPVEAGSSTCTACGHPLTTVDTGGGPGRDVPAQHPADYIPYCRSCGVGVPWGQGHTCPRCGVAPLCTLHFRASDGYCFDCANSPSYVSGETTTGGLRCGACGAAVGVDTEFCPDCGRALALRHAGVEYMGFWIRAAAFVADWIFAYLVSALIAAIIGISLTSGDVEPGTMQEVQFTLENFNYSFLLLFCGIAAAHGVIMTTLKGQTLGKMLLRIQVVDADGNVPPWPRAVVRELLRGVILLALLPLGLLYIWVALDARKRGPHDYIGRSFVVRKQRGARTPNRIL